MSKYFDDLVTLHIEHWPQKGKKLLYHGLEIAEHLFGRSYLTDIRQKKFLSSCWLELGF